jgi:hypothetical protein
MIMKWGKREFRMRVNETNGCLKTRVKEDEKEKRPCIFFYLIPAIFVFLWSIHCWHLFNNSTTSLEGSIVSFTSKVNNFFST